MDHDEISGGEPLADGMHIVFRLRRDFTVTSASRLLAAARAAYVQVNPGAAAEDAATAVTSAADAVFTILESHRLAGDAADRALAARAGHGLEPGGWRGQVTLNESPRRPAGARCGLALLAMDDGAPHRILSAIGASAPRLGAEIRDRCRPAG